MGWSTRPSTHTPGPSSESPARLSIHTNLHRESGTMALQTYTDNFGNVCNNIKKRFKEASYANRWLLFMITEAFIERFIINFRHVGRLKNKPADALSRCDIPLFKKELRNQNADYAKFAYQRCRPHHNKIMHYDNK